MAFSLRQQQGKCKRQGESLYITFFDLNKAFVPISGDGLFQILAKIGCPPTLLSIVKSFHEDMKRAIVYDGSTLEQYDIRSGVKQGCILAQTLFSIFFAFLLKHAFGSATEGIFLRKRSEGNLFKLSRLRAKTKVQTKCPREFLFADDAAVTTHSEKDP